MNTGRWDYLLKARNIIISVCLVYHSPLTLVFRDLCVSSYVKILLWKKGKKKARTFLKTVVISTAKLSQHTFHVFLFGSSRALFLHILMCFC